MLRGIEITRVIDDQQKLIHAIKNSDTNEIYKSALESQVRFCSLAIRNSLQKFSIWTNSRSILDAGCGPAAFAKEFEGLFEGKAYLGIDINEDFIRTAKTKFLDSKKFQFEVRDLHESLSRNFDTVLLWAVLQHVPDTKKALSALSRYTDSFIILDTRVDKYEIISEPKLPVLQGYYDQLDKQSLKHGRKSDCLLNVREWAIENNWRIVIDEGFGPRAQTSEQKQVFVYYTCFVSELFLRLFGIETDLSLLLKELEIWRQVDNSFVENRGGQWLGLVK